MACVDDLTDPGVATTFAAFRSGQRELPVFHIGERNILERMEEALGKKPGGAWLPSQVAEYGVKKIDEGQLGTRREDQANEAEYARKTAEPIKRLADIIRAEIDKAVSAVEQRLKAGQVQRGNIII